MRYGFNMSTITIKNVPSALHLKLKARAKAHGRSLNREVINTLERALHSVPLDGDAVSRRAREVRESMGVFLRGSDLSRFKNSGRR